MNNEEPKSLPRLLIVEDDQLIASCLARGLRGEVDLTIVNRGEDAMTLLGSQNQARFDAILSDLNMPDITGIELRRRIRTIDPVMAERFAFMTGGAIDSKGNALIDDEPERCLEKPFTIQQLRAFLRRQGLRVDTP